MLYKKAEDYFKSSEAQRTFSEKYHKLPLREQRRIEKRLSRMELGTYLLAGPLGITVGYLNNQRYLKDKVYGTSI